jgi:hypothetical protein
MSLTGVPSVAAQLGREPIRALELRAPAAHDIRLAGHLLRDAAKQMKSSAELTWLLA